MLSFISSISYLAVGGLGTEIVKDLMLWSKINTKSHTFNIRLDSVFMGIEGSTIVRGGGEGI